jgi:hypothetical protein
MSDFKESGVKKRLWLAAALVGFLPLRSGLGLAETVSPLLGRGYTVIPQPQEVTLTGREFEFGGGWRLEPGEGIEAS